MKLIKSILVIGNGGSRIDFVSGWLGKLPGFIDTNWCIDPKTGQSTGDMNLTKQLDYNLTSLKFVFKECGYVLSDDAKYSFASSCHGFNLDNQIGDCNGNNLKIIRIVNLRNHYSKVSWEYIAKTYLQDLTDYNTIYNVIDSSIKSQEDINKASVEIVKDIINKSIDYIKEAEDPMVNFKTIDIEYEKLLSVTGAYYLSNQLNLKLTQKDYQLWESALPLASTPNEIYAFDYLWRKQDFFPD